MWKQLEIEFTWSYLEEWEIDKVGLIRHVHPDTDFIVVNLASNRIVTVGDWFKCFEWTRIIQDLWKNERCTSLRDLHTYYQIIRNPRAH